MLPAPRKPSGKSNLDQIFDREAFPHRLIATGKAAHPVKMVCGATTPVQRLCNVAHPDLNQAGASAVNPHYLDHVMTVAEDREVEATEDIYAENAMKLVAKGYAINAALRERLIRHKLVKPLEDCMAVAGGVTGERCAEVAERLLASHPALRAMCPSDKGPSSPLRLLKEACPTGRLQTLLTVYAEHRPGKLEHAVRVSLLAMSLAQRMLPKDRQVPDVLLVAGLAHDVGELYIDPQYLQPGARLGPKEWRHIAAHPVIAHGLLTTLEGSAKPAAELILNHHERLDGFGYPLGKRAGQLSEAAQ